MDHEQLLEEQHLEQCKAIIRENIHQYEQQEQVYKKEITELFQAVRHGEGDSYGRLIAEQNILEHTKNSLRKNRAALEKAYFGRIDYTDKTFGEEESYYIGKNGITKDRTDLIIIDWRAPVSSVYYENELGDGSYDVPDAKPISIDLKKKRTYDISNGTLLGFYDDDVATNDELLVNIFPKIKKRFLEILLQPFKKNKTRLFETFHLKILSYKASLEVEKQPLHCIGFRTFFIIMKIDTNLPNFVSSEAMICCFTIFPVDFQSWMSTMYLKCEWTVLFHI